MFPAFQRWFQRSTRSTPLNERGDNSPPLRTGFVADSDQQTRNQRLWDELQQPFPMVHSVHAALRAGADVQALLPESSEQGGGQTPIEAMVHRERWDLVNVLLHHGANPNGWGTSLLEWQDVSTQENTPYRGTLPIFSIAWLKMVHQTTSTRYCNDDVQGWRAIDALLAKGADPLVRTAGTTALEQAMMVCESLNAWPADQKSPKRLQALGATLADAQGVTPLHRLASNPQHQINVWTALINAGADPHAPDHEGNSPLHHLARQVALGYHEAGIVSQLNQNYPTLDWTRSNDRGETPTQILLDAAPKRWEMSYESMVTQHRTHVLRVDTDALHHAATLDEQAVVDGDTPTMDVVPRRARL